VTQSLSNLRYANHMRARRGEPLMRLPAPKFNINNLGEAIVPGDGNTYCVTVSVIVRGPGEVILSLYDMSGLLQEIRMTVPADEWHTMALSDRYAWAMDRKIYMRVTGGLVRGGSPRLLVEEYGRL